MGWRAVGVMAVVVCGALVVAAGGCGPADGGEPLVAAEPLVDIQPAPAPPPGPITGEAPWRPQWPALAPLEHYALDFDAASAAILYDVSRGKYPAPATFTAGGRRYPVELKRRGQGALTHPKPSWTVTFAGGDRLDGERKLKLLAEWLDSGNLSDVFSYGLLNAAGTLAPRARYALLTVNGKPEGVYTVVEAVDKSFLESRGLDKDASIYRCGARDCEMKITPPAHYQAPWEKKTNEAVPFDDLWGFLTAISRTPEHEVEQLLANQLGLEDYLRTLAAHILLSRTGEDDSGSYLIHDFRRDRWFFVPWDLNNSRIVFLRTDKSNAVPRVKWPVPVFTLYDELSLSTLAWKENKYGGAHLPFSNLNQRIWDRPALRHRVLDHLELLLQTVFTEEEAFARIDAQQAMIGAEVQKDPYVSLSRARHAPVFLKAYVKGRREFLLGAIAAERTRGAGGLLINAIGQPGGAHADEQGRASGFVELFNAGDRAVDLGGLTLTDDLRTPFKVRLPAGLLVPAGGTRRLWADGKPERGPGHLPFTLPPGGGELGVFDGKSATGALDVAFFGRMEPASAYARLPDGSEEWSWRP